jgi:uncharacterized membrane protein
MVKTLYRITPWLILLLTFVILAFSYDSIPDEVLIFRSFGGNNSTFAPKTLFTIFRVPLIEVVCASAIEVMRRKFAGSNSGTHADYHSMWSVLLYTVAFKSLFQTFEDVSPQEVKPLFFYLTISVVIIGIILTLIKGKDIFPVFRRENWTISRAEKLVLIILFILYLGLAFAPIIIFG